MALSDELRSIAGYGGATGNVMSFGDPMQQQMSTPMQGQMAVDPNSILDDLVRYYDMQSGPSAGLSPGNPDMGLAVDIGIGPPSGGPGAGGLGMGGLAGAINAGSGFLMNPMMFGLKALLNMIMSDPAVAAAVAADSGADGTAGNATGPGGSSSTAGAPNSTGAGGGIAVGPDADAQQNQAPGTDAGAAPGDSGGVAAGNGPGEDAAGFAKGGMVKKSDLKGPKPNAKDDGVAPLKVGEGVLTQKAVAKMGKDVFEKLNSGDFDPAMLRFAVLRKVSEK